MQVCRISGAERLVIQNGLMVVIRLYFGVKRELSKDTETVAVVHLDTKNKATKQEEVLLNLMQHGAMVSMVEVAPYNLRHIM